MIKCAIETVKKHIKHSSMKYKNRAKPSVYYMYTYCDYQVKHS